MLLLAFALQAATVPALPPEEADLRCLASIAYRGGIDAKARALRDTGSVYFIGKLVGRTPEIDLSVRLGEVTQAMTPAMLKAELPRCLAELGALAKRLKTTGTALQKR